jgi:putative transposase
MCAEHEWLIVALDVIPDHVQPFVKAHPKHSPSFIAHQVKGPTSPAVRAEYPHLRSRLPTLWPGSFFEARVGALSAGTVERYLDTQSELPWRQP